MCVYIYIYIYTHIYLHIYLLTHISTCVNTHINNATTGVMVDRRLTGHLQPREPCTTLLGREPRVACFRERSSFLDKHYHRWEFVRKINASFSRPFGNRRCAKHFSWEHHGAASTILGPPEAQERSANSRPSHEVLPLPTALLGSLSEEII